MIKKLALPLGLLLLAAPAHSAVSIPLENGSFENGLTGWTARAGEAMFSVAPASASLGASGLRVNDNDSTVGALSSGLLPAEADHTYQLTFWGRMDSKAPGTNIKIEYYDAEGKALQGVTVKGGWGGAGVKYKGGFVSYSARSGAPAGTKTMRVVIETWGKATSITSMDDFQLEDITDGKPSEINVEALVAAAKAAKAAGKSMPKIIIKTDDLKQVNDRIYPRWQKLADFAQERKIKVGIGIVFETMEQDAPKYIAWIKQLHATGLFEFWNHGYDHAQWKEGDKTLQEFKGSSYEHQKEHITKSNKLAREKLGFPMVSFGAPFNSIDANTLKVLAEDPDIQVVMYADEVPGKVALPRNFSVNIEYPTFVPKYDSFVEGYVHNLDAPVLVIQGHPNAWDDNRWNNFVQMVDFLQSVGAEFVFASDYAPKK